MAHSIIEKINYDGSPDSTNFILEKAELMNISAYLSPEGIVFSEGDDEQVLKPGDDLIIQKGFKNIVTCQHN